MFRNDNDREDLVVWQVGAYTLEEALHKAKVGIKGALTEQENKEKNYKMIMHANDEPEVLMGDFFEEEKQSSTDDFRSRLEKRLGVQKGMFQMAHKRPDDMPSPDGESANAILMKKIIDEKNLDLFRKSKALFSESELKYIKDKLKEAK